MDSTFVINCLETNNIDLMDTDPEHMCRTCTTAKTEDFRSVFEITMVLKDDAGKPYQISEIIQSLMGTTVRPDDLLPKNICRSCLQRLYSAYNFLTLAKRIDGAFRKYIGTKDPLWQDQEEAEKEEDDEQLPSAVEEADDEYIEVAHLESASERGNDLYYAGTADDDKDDVQMVFDKEPDSPKKAASEERPPSLSPRRQRVPTVKTQTPAKRKGTPLTQPSPGGGDDGQTTVLGDIKQFKCQHCDKSYSFVQALTRHYNAAHSETGEKKTCPHCRRLFTRADALKRHIRTHTNERPYACPYCDKKFKQSSELKEHILSHTKTASFECGICGKILTTRMGLYTHTKGMHKNPTAETKRTKRMSKTRTES